MGLYPKPEESKQWMWPYYGTANRVYCVDSVNGSDSYNGFSWQKPKASIDAAIDLARYQLGTTTIDSSKDHHAVVLVAPGHYNEQLLFSGYNIHLIGCGCPVPGKDYGVSINYDGAVASTAVLAFSGSGIHIANLHIHCAEAIPAVLMAYPGDNNLIENCVIECDGTNCTYGILAQSMKGSRIRNCVIIDPKTAGIFLDGGDERYAINGGIDGCQIRSAVAGVKGIYIEDTMTVYNFRVFQNFIDVEGGGATCKGIDNDAGRVIIADNYVVVETGATAIESASHGMLNNHVSVGGTVTDPQGDS